MQISALKKLLQLISQSDSLNQEKSSEATSDQSKMQNVSSNKTVDNCFLRSECAETRSNESEACPHEQYDYVSRDEMQNDEEAVEDEICTEAVESEDKIYAEATEDADEICAEGEEDSATKRVAAAENNRSHLTSSVPRVARAPYGAMTKGELAEIRSLFNNLDDSEIQRLYKRVTKQN